MKASVICTWRTKWCNSVHSPHSESQEHHCLRVREGAIRLPLLFGPFSPPVDCVLPTYIGEGGSPLLSLLIQMLLSSRNMLHSSIRKPCFTSTLHTLSLVKATSKINYHSRDHCLRQWPQGTMSGWGWPLERDIWPSSVSLVTQDTDMGYFPKFRKEGQRLCGPSKGKEGISPHAHGPFCVVQVYSRGRGLGVGNLGQRFICISKFGDISQFLLQSVN